MTEWSAPLRSVLAALVLVALAIAPAAAGSGPTRLSDAAVSARSGTTANAIIFTVAYRNREGSPADWVRVSVGGGSHEMAQSGGEDWKRQVWFTWTGTLPAGTHAITFQAMSRDRFDDSLDGGTVAITVPATPPPTPTPQPTAAPTQAPEPTPSPAPQATPTAAPLPTATPRPTAGPTATPRPTDVPDPTRPAGGSTLPSPSTGSSNDPAGSALPSPDANNGTIAGVVPGDTSGGDLDNGTGSGPAAAGDGFGPGGPADDAAAAASGGSGGAGGSDGSGGGPIGALASALTTVGLGRPELPLGLLFTMTTTTGVVGAAMAFSVFGKRRREGEQPATDAILAEAAASGVGAGGAATLVGGVFGGPPAPTPADLEMAMPRWRRPSLLEARKADPLRDATVTPRLTFDHGLVGALDGRERRLIRYTLVRLLDRPDELRGSEIGFLDSGDEVQLLEKLGVYWLVLCPDGRQGWIHKMTLGEASGQLAHQTSPTATMPIDADTWTMGDDVDGDVLSAYLESRRRT